MSKPTSANSPKVLVVEDDELLRKILCQTIQRIGFIAIPTSNGEMGLEKLNAEPIDIVVSDIMMPKMTGLELLQKAVSLGFIQPFIIISSQHKRDVLMQALKFGAFDFIDKPFQASVISQVLDEAYRYSQRLKQFASTLHIGNETQKIFSIGEMEKIYLLRLLEATSNPFGGAAGALERLGKSDKADGERFFYETGKKAEAIKTMRDLVRKYPMFPDMRAALTAALWTAGQQGEAESHWVAAVGMDSRYQNLDWVKEIRRWPPTMIAALDSFLNLQ